MEKVSKGLAILWICFGCWYGSLVSGKGSDSSEDYVRQTSTSRSSRQLLYSPFLFPGNYQQSGLPSSSTNLSPVGGGAYNPFWSNLHSVPTLHKSGVDNTADQQGGVFQLLPSHDGGLAIATLDQTAGNEFKGPVQYVDGGDADLLDGTLATAPIILPHSQVEHGNVWNFEDPSHPFDKAPVSPASGLFGYYFPFVNDGELTGPMSQMTPVKKPSKTKQTVTGFQRGYVEARPGNHVPRRSMYSGVRPGSSPGFNRGDVEARPNAAYSYGQIYRPTSFDRGAVEAKPHLGYAIGERMHGNRAGIGGNQKLVCYFANWASYRLGKGSFVPENINATLCTHVIYAFATFDKNTQMIQPSDPATDVDKNFYRRTVALKQVNPDLKVLLSVGGWADSGDDKYSNLAHNPEQRRRFAQESVKFLTWQHDMVFAMAAVTY